MKQEIVGPLAYENWKAKIAEENWRQIFEYPLFTDAEMIGEITDGIGPYQIINNLPLNSGRPALILRIQHCGKTKQLQMDKTQSAHYHGGTEEDEIAALLSLCLGVRMKAGNPSRMFEKDGDAMGRPIGASLIDDPNLVSIKPRHRRP